MADTAETKIDLKLADAKAEAAAEKAYAAAAQLVETAPVAQADPKVAVQPASAVVAPVAKTTAAARSVPISTKHAVKPATVKTSVKKSVAAKKIVKAAAMPVAAKTSTISQFKDTIMAKTQNVTEDFTAKVKVAVADVQDRAKVAFEKSTAMLGDMNEFSKGNVEALVESSKILATGLQELGKDYVAEGKSAIETLTADVKEFAAVKSPTDFFKLQGEIMRRNFDAVIASGSKHSEVIVKLANEAFAPISTRVSIAVEKVKQAA